MPPAYDVHPEFGYFCPAPRVRRELRVAVVSILVGMVIGAAIVAIHAGQAVETEAVSSNAQLKSSGSRHVGGRASQRAPEFKNADNAKADPVEAIKPYPMRMVRVRSSKAASPLAGIPLGRTAHRSRRSHQPPQVRRRPRTQRVRRRRRLHRKRNHSQQPPSPPPPAPGSGQALCMRDVIGTTRMRTHAGRTGVRPTGASAAMPMIDIGAAHIATGCTDESRCRERAVARLAPQKAGVARSSDSGRTDFCGQDICGILARTLHRILGRPRRSTMGVSDRLHRIATG